MTATHAPVALFVYRRPSHARRTLDALAANAGARETDLIVFADGARGAEDAAAVEATRAVCAAATGFRSVEIVARPRNIGLADNIAAGVDETMARYGRAIVLEDDIETAPGFLAYMNAALDRYAHEDRLWHISGWSYPIDPSGLPPYFCWQMMNCWGWASWADRWSHYRREPERLLASWPRETRRRFDLDGACDFFGQVEDNASGRIRTWAVFWYATIFEAGGLCLNPTVPFARNIGMDGSGEHCGASEIEQASWAPRFDGGLPDEVAPSQAALARVRAHLVRPWPRRLSRRLRRTVRRFDFAASPLRSARP